MKTFLRLLCANGNLLSHRGGATAIEYALIAGLIALGIIGTVSQIGTQTNDSYVAVSAGFHQ